MHYSVRTATPASMPLVSQGSRSNSIRSVAAVPTQTRKVACRSRNEAQKKLSSARIQSPCLRPPTSLGEAEISAADGGICMTQAKALKAYKGYLDGLDAVIARSPEEHRGALEAQFLSREEHSFNVFLDGSLGVLVSRSSRLGSHALAAFGDAFRSHFGPCDGACAYGPFGSCSVGEGLFAKLVHQYPLQATAMEHSRACRRLIVDELRDVMSTPGKMRLLSVGCGSCDELPGIFDSAEAFERLEMVLVDAHLPTVQQACNMIQNLSESAGQTPKISLMRKSVASFSRPHSLARMGEFDVVYSMGLFEHLPHDAAGRLAGGIKSLLKPGGALIIGCGRPEKPVPSREETWMDWNLVPRSKSDLLRLAGEGLQAEVKTIAGTSSRQIFLKAFK